MLVDLTMGVQDEIEKKVNHLFKFGSTNILTIDEYWKSIYIKTRKDPYCDYDKLLKTKYEGIEMMPYGAEKPDFLAKDPSKFFYKVTYLVRINPNSKTPHSFFLQISYDNFSSDRYYYITRYNNHCPIPNLIPEVDIHDYHLKPE